MAGYSVTFTVVDNATKQIEAINRRIAQTRAPLDRMSRQISRFVDVSGLRKVATGFEWIGKAASTVLRSLTAIVPVMGAITGAASIAGMTKLVATYADWSQELVAAADNIGTTTQKLQQFEDATRLAGGNASDMRDSLKGLHDRLADFNRGGPNAAATGQWANKLGINLRDANGEIRTAADLLPELVRKIGELKDPADRAAAANALLGSSGEKLVETFRQSHQSFSQWFTDAGRYTELTNDQKRSLQDFSEAQGRVATAFDHLGQQISAVLARDFAPLLQRLAEFVEQHTPEIIAAVDSISQRFVAWLQGVDWSKVLDGINKVIDGLKWVVTHLDTIKDVAEGIAVLFAVKWALGIVTSIGKVVTALGSVGGGAAGAATAGSGLLGALGAVAGLAAALAAAYGAKQALDAGSEKVERGIFGDERVDEGKRLKEQGSEQFWRQIPNWLGGTGGAAGGLGTLWNRAMRGPAAIQQQGGVAPPSSMNLPTDTVQRGAAISSRLASDLDLSGPQAAGIVGNLQAESGMRAVQEVNPIGGGRGGYGWAQWTGPRRLQFEQYAKEHNLDPASDEANYGFLRQELKAPENAKLLEQLRALKGPDAAKQSAALVERLYERPAVSNASVRGRYAEQFVPATATAPPVQVAQAAPVNGSVDVSITHKNPPPNSAVTATGSGAVNVAPPRVEHQQMASI